MAEGPRRLPVIALAAWTLFVWLSRVRNVVDDDDLSTAALVGGLALASSFLVLAAFALRALGDRRRLGPATLVLAGWTVVVWIVRGIDIATGDHSIGFVVVHLALAAVSIALAAWAARSVLQLRDGFSAATTDG